MRTLVIGDIHGCLRAFDTMLNAVELEADDILITLGDYIDRGPDSKGVIDRLIELSEHHRLIPLRGNHEEILQEATFHPSVFRSWLTFGGEETLQSYSGSPSEFELRDIPMEHWHFFNKRLRNYFETKTHIFVHGGVDPTLPMHKQNPKDIRWMRFENPQPHCSGKIVVCGHTAQENGRPRNLGHSICIDTWVYGDGYLTGFDVNSGKCWQANEKGETSYVHINEFLERPDGKPALERI